MTQVKTIAIDGPAASGKSTLGLKLANALGYLFFDTGVMYRAVTWAAIQRNIPMDDAEALTRMAEELDIDLLPATQQDGRTSTLLVNDQDVTWEIRRADVDANVSVVSAIPGVRTAMTEKQRRIGLRGNVVMVGRDIGTVVMPEADFKLYLDASDEERARRRYDELIGRGEKAEYEQVLAAMRKRDRIDSTRKVAPLKPASDAIIFHSDEIGAQDVLEKVLELVKAWQRRSVSNQESGEAG